MADDARKPERARPSALGALLPPLLLCTAVAVVYHDSLAGPFIFDDLNAIVDNPQIRRLLPLSRFLDTPPGLTVSARPLVSLTLAVNFALGGLDVVGYHLFNILAHLVCGLLLLGLVRRLLELRGAFAPAERRWLACAVALLWLVHPLATEAVSYVIQRTELLVALLTLATLYSFVRGRQVVGRRRALWYAAAVLACACGMASKAVMVVCPLLVLLLDLCLGGSPRAALRARWPLYAGLAACWALLAWLQAGAPRAESVGFDGPAGPFAYLSVQLAMVAHYLRLAFWPHPLLLDYGDWSMAAHISTVSRVVGGALLGALAGASAHGLLRRSLFGWLGACFFLILAPTSSVLPIVTEIGAERRAYLPLAAVVAAVVLLGWGLARPRGRRYRRGAVAVAALLAALLAALAIARNDDYRSAVTIWRDTVAKAPRNGRAHEGLGGVLLAAGELSRAIPALRRAVALRPGAASSHSALGSAYARSGRLAAAQRHLRAALRLDPRHAGALNNLGNLLARQGRTAAAIRHFRRALALAPSFVDCRVNLGRALLIDGQRAAGVAALRQAQAEDPGHVGALHALARLHSDAGQLQRALALYRRAARRGPREARFFNDYGVALARAGQLRAAVKLFRLALRFAPDDRQAHHNLGVALGNLGQRAAAARHLRRARRPASRPATPSRRPPGSGD